MFYMLLAYFFTLTINFICLRLLAPNCYLYIDRHGIIKKVVQLIQKCCRFLIWPSRSFLSSQLNFQSYNWRSVRHKQLKI